MPYQSHNMIHSPYPLEVDRSAKVCEFLNVLDILLLSGDVSGELVFPCKHFLHLHDIDGETKCACMLAAQVN